MSVYRIIQFDSITHNGKAIAPDGSEHKVSMTYAMSIGGDWYNETEKRWLNPSEIKIEY